VATAGFFYVNIMPALVESLTGGLGFDSRQAGLVSAANVYGSAFGALLAVLLVRRLPWRRVAPWLLLALIAMDGISMQLVSPPPLIAVRALHGILGGMLVGLTYGVIARFDAPERTFGILLALQFGLGGLGVALLPRLVPAFGTHALFFTLIALSAAGLLALRRLPEIDGGPRVARGLGGALTSAPLLLVLFALFLFQAANMGLYAFIIDLGRHHGLGADFMSAALLASAWVGIGGALLVTVTSTRFGRLVPISLAAAATALLTWLLLASGMPWAYAVANLGIGVTWAFVVPYLFGIAAELDRSGRAAALAGLASKLGLASGPLAAGFLLADGRYTWLIHLSAIALLASALSAMLPAQRLDRGATLRPAA
jgi:predicted MFS family arabinose efflux permease